MGMLILSRKPEQSLVIQGDIIIKVLGVDGDRVKLGVIAPAGVKVVRSELLDAVRAENRAAVRAGAEVSNAASALRQVLEARQEAGVATRPGLAEG